MKKLQENQLVQVDIIVKAPGYVQTENCISVKPKYRTQNNYNYLLEKYESKSSETRDMCIPDQSYTIPEILEKFTQGLRLDDIFRQPLFDDQADLDNDLEITPEMDRFDVMDMKRDLDERIAQAQRIKPKGKQADKAAPVKDPRSSEADEQNPEQKPTEKAADLET